MSDAKDLVRKQYGSVGDAYVQSASHASGQDLPRMLELAAPDGTETLLDIATGGGHVVRKFAPHVASVVASDLTPEILVHATQAFAEWELDNVTTAVADAESMPFDGGKFDIVSCRIAPHHFPNPAAFVTQVARVLKPGGKFLLVDSTVPEGEDGEFYNQFEKVRDHSHVRSLSIAEWSSLIDQNELSLQHVEDYPKRHDFEDWVTRSRTSDDDRQQLIEMMLNATRARQELFGVEIHDGNLVAFRDVKTLFHAVKALTAKL